MQSSPQPNLQNKFGETLREIRKEAGLSQSKLSERSGLSVNFISFCERGIMQPTINSLWLLSGALELTVRDFVTRVEAKKPIPNP